MSTDANNAIFFDNDAKVWTQKGKKHKAREYRLHAQLFLNMIIKKSTVPKKSLPDKVRSLGMLSNTKSEVS